MASENKPKIYESGRDMILSLGVIVIAMFVVVGATGLCTINPETSQQGPAHEVDAETFLKMEAQSSGAAIRIPKLPEGWYTNSARRQSVAGEIASTVGYVSPSESYIAASQTKVELPDAAKKYDVNFRPNESEKDIDGVKVTVYSSDDRDVRPVWAADLGDVRLVMSGSASDEDYATLLRAFKDAPHASAQ